MGGGVNSQEKAKILGVLGITSEHVRNLLKAAKGDTVHGNFLFLGAEGQFVEGFIEGARRGI